MSKTQKNVVTTNPPAIAVSEYAESVNDSAIILRDTINAVFDPQKVKTAKDAVIFITTQRNVSNKFGLSAYRVMGDVAINKLWQDDMTADGKPFTSFEHWAEYHFGIKRSQAYNARNAGQFITPDGQHTTLKHYTALDWSFSHLVLFAECKDLYDISGKGKDKTKVFKMVCDIEKAYDQNGKTVKVDGKYVWVDVLDEKGQPARFITLLEKLCILGEITPEMSVKQCEKRIKEYVNGKVMDITDDSAETTDDSAETTDDSAETTDDSAETFDEKPAVKLTRKVVLTDDDSKAIVNWLTRCKNDITYDPRLNDGSKDSEILKDSLSELERLIKLIKQ